MLCEFQNWKCFYCGVIMISIEAGHQGPLLPNHATLDHYIPVSLNGESKSYNYVAACNDCNLKAMDAPPNEKLEVIAAKKCGYPKMSSWPQKALCGTVISSNMESSMNEVAQRLKDHIDEFKNARMARVPVELLQAAYKEIVSLELKKSNKRSTFTPAPIIEEER